MKLYCYLALFLILIACGCSSSSSPYNISTYTAQDNTPDYSASPSAVEGYLTINTYRYDSDEGLALYTSIVFDQNNLAIAEWYSEDGGDYSYMQADNSYEYNNNNTISKTTSEILYFYKGATITILATMGYTYSANNSLSEIQYCYDGKCYFTAEISYTTDEQGRDVVIYDYKTPAQYSNEELFDFFDSIPVKDTHVYSVTGTPMSSEIVTKSSTTSQYKKTMYEYDSYGNVTFEAYRMVSDPDDEPTSWTNNTLYNAIMDPNGYPLARYPFSVSERPFYSGKEYKGLPADSDYREYIYANGKTIRWSDYDIDGDGFLSEVDCDDNDSTSYPWFRTCGLFQTYENGCNYIIARCSDYEFDYDGDGYTMFDGGDCDESNPDINPGVDEICGDEIDNDCQFGTDDGHSVDATWYSIDYDGDGYGSQSNGYYYCEQPDDMVLDNTDCNDYVYSETNEC